MDLPPETVENLSVAGLPALIERRAARVLWVDDAGARTWLEFGAEVEAARQAALAAGVGRGEVVLAPGAATLASLAWLFGLASVGAAVLPLRAERRGEVAGWRSFVRLDWEAADGAVRPLREGSSSAETARLLEGLKERDEAGLILATGGTTGSPKLVLHELGAQLATVRVKQGRARRIMPLMRFDHIGGLDMAWRALAGGHVLVAPPSDLQPHAVAAAVARHNVEVLPATPSFLNLFVAAEAHRGHNLTSLRTVPYGAEPMPVALLARLHAEMPQVEFVQRFGTSETGVLPVTEAGAGLLLGDDAAGFQWKIVAGELWVRSPARALGYLTPDNGRLTDGGWFRTGDLAEKQPDGGVRILGRREDLINVGGEKVLPAEVEGVLLGHPSVADCRVFAAPNALLGSVVAAEVVWRGAETDPVAVKRALHEFAGATLERHKLPVQVRLVAAIETTRHLKKPRAVST